MTCFGAWTCLRHNIPVIPLYQVTKSPNFFAALQWAFQATESAARKRTLGALGVIMLGALGVIMLKKEMWERTRKTAAFKSTSL